MKTDKDALRARLRTKRAALAGAFRRLSSHTITEHILGHLPWQNCTTVGLYASLDAPHFEVLTTGLHSALLQRGCTLAYPRVCDDSLEFAAIADTSRDLESGPWGLQEPKPTCPVVAIADIELLIVPGVAFTPNGDRLGQGGGYYDRLLANPSFTGWTVGVTFQCGLVPTLPTQPWDQPVHWIATEEGLFAARPTTLA